MNQGKTRLFCVAEHPLRVGMVLVALIWVIGSLVETLVSSDGTLPSMLLPAQSEQTWDHRLLALVVLFFACYTRRDQGMNDTDRYAALRYPRLDYGVVSSVLTRPPVYTGSTVTHEQGEAYYLRRPGHRKRMQPRARRAHQRGLVGISETLMFAGVTPVPEEV